MTAGSWSQDCIDDPDSCIFFSDLYFNQADCEEYGGIWGGYIEVLYPEYSSCDDMINDLSDGCDQPLYYSGGIVSDICPVECGICCSDVEACNTNEVGDCEYAMENYDCDGYCTADIDCADECGGSAVVDE